METQSRGAAPVSAFLGILLALAWYFSQQAIVAFSVVNGLAPLATNLLPAMLTAALAWVYFRQLA